VTSIFTAETYFAFIALGFAVGTFGTLIGAGGGFVLMPLLLLLYPQEAPEKLTSISLAIVFFNALSGSEAYAKMRRIDYKVGLIFALATIPGAVVGALNTAYVPRRLFDIIFGVLMVAAAVFLFLRPKKPARESKPSRTGPGRMVRRLVDADGTVYEYAFDVRVGVILSLLVGYASSFLGIGGGIIHVPALVYLLSFPAHVATATSHFILAIMALTGTAVHMWKGVFAHGVHHMISISIGVVAGAQLGALLSQRIRAAWIMRSLALGLGLIGVRILIMVIYRQV
jgi:uncharacterized protein